MYNFGDFGKAVFIFKNENTELVFVEGADFGSSTILIDEKVLEGKESVDMIEKIKGGGLKLELSQAWINGDGLEIQEWEIEWARREYEKFVKMEVIK